MNNFFTFLFLVSVLFPYQVANASTVDLGFKNKNAISFSEEILVAGDRIRIYAEVSNYGDTDVVGYVSFNQGTIPVGDTQVISVRSGGQEEEVYVDFIVPESPFNIRAEIKGTDPTDTNSSNDIIISELFDPILDDDHDGIENDVDNCPSVENNLQTDSDSDGVGNACDDDDDNDGLTDSVENEIGTNEKSSDTDGDGTLDPDDYAPTDTTLSSQPVTVPVTETIETPVNVVEEPVIVETGTEENSDLTPTEEDTTAETKEGNATETHLEISPKAFFTFERISWNSFIFRTKGFENDSYRYDWDFGDGVSSSKFEIEHRYRQFGDYTVVFSVTDENGVKSTDSVLVSVSFFNSENPYLQILLGILGILFLLSLGFLLKSLRRSRKYVETSSSE